MLHPRMRMMRYSLHHPADSSSNLTFYQESDESSDSSDSDSDSDSDKPKEKKKKDKPPPHVFKVCIIRLVS